MGGLSNDEVADMMCGPRGLWALTLWIAILGSEKALKIEERRWQTGIGSSFSTITLLLCGPGQLT